MNCVYIRFMDACCHEPDQHSHHQSKIDWLFWGSLIFVSLGYIGHFFQISISPIHHYTSSVFELMNRMWVGLAIGIIFVGVLTKIPQAFIMSILGRPYSFQGVLRAALAGLLLDMCSHGILLVGMKFYKRGASLGQTMAFLISSPWNSLSLTIILISLIGLKWTLVFIVLSMVVAVVSGWIFDRLVIGNVLPSNPNMIQMPESFSFFSEARRGIKHTRFNIDFFRTMIWDGLKDSKMIIKWILFGTALTALIRVLVPEDTFSKLLGPSLMGLLGTLVLATVIEICSEGAAPMAADIVRRAGAVGNGFLFLMAGVSTDYTEIMSIRETTRSWKITLFLPLVTVPQIMLLAYFLNHFH